jgi:hypothetical protein
VANRREFAVLSLYGARDPDAVAAIRRMAVERQRFRIYPIQSERITAVTMQTAQTSSKRCIKAQRSRSA